MTFRNPVTFAAALVAAALVTAGMRPTPAAAQDAPYALTAAPAGYLDVPVQEDAPVEQSRAPRVALELAVGTAALFAGGLGWTVFGSTAGMLAWAGMLAASGGNELGWLGAVLPAVGGALGFELSSAQSASAERERAARGPSLSASLAPHRDGALVSVSGTF